MMPDEILVVFSDQTDLWWLKILRRGFRHCFVLIRFADIWVSVDPLAHRTEVLRIDVPDVFNLQEWFESQGDRVVRMTDRSPLTDRPIPLYPALFSCVEAVKRILGLRQWSIFTPWQLYQILQKGVI